MERRRTDTIRTLMVEDDPVVAALHREYLAVLPGFELVGEAGTVADAVRMLEATTPDLVLLDVQLPDGTGLALLRELRRARVRTPDVIMITAMSSRLHVEAARRLGVVDYLVKPFSRVEFERRLGAFRDSHRRRGQVAAHRPLSQAEVDSLRGSGHQAPLPKGLAPASLEAVEQALADGEPRTATEVGDLVGFSRVSARRYLEHLVSEGLALAQPRYGGTGRPSTVYVLRGAAETRGDQYDR